MDMSFDDFIKNLSEEDKNNFEKYKDFRGVQYYKIIYTTLINKCDNVTYTDVNSFIRYDKALKDVLYTYLGTLEDYTKNYILCNFDFTKDAKLEKDYYVYFDKLPACEKKNVGFGEITELYKRYALVFDSMIQFLRKYSPDKFDLKRLINIKDLRNDVMHHKPLLFDVNFDSKNDNINKKISSLIELLPESHRIGLKNALNDKTLKTKENIKEEYYDFLLEEF